MQTQCCEGRDAIKQGVTWDILTSTGPSKNNLLTAVNIWLWMFWFITQQHWGGQTTQILFHLNSPLAGAPNAWSNHMLFETFKQKNDIAFCFKETRPKATPLQAKPHPSFFFICRFSRQTTITLQEDLVELTLAQKTPCSLDDILCVHLCDPTNM